MVSSNTSMLYAFVLSRLLLYHDAKEGGRGSELNITIQNRFLSVQKTIAYGKYSTVCYVYNILKVAKKNYLSTRNALNQIKHHHARAI